MQAQGMGAFTVLKLFEREDKEEERRRRRIESKSQRCPSPDLARTDLDPGPCAKEKRKK